MTKQKIDLSFYTILFVYFCILIFVSNSLSISIKEVDIFYSNDTNILWYLTHISTHFFGTTNLGLRFPFIVFYVFSVLLAYLLSEDYFTKDIDRLISILIFMLLPGLNSAALLVDNAIIVVFFVLLYLYLHKLYGKEYYLLLVLFLFIDNSFTILYLALFFYSIQEKDKILMAVSITLFIVSIIIFGFFIGGHPRGYFIDTFVIYAFVFSPIIFIYFFYAMYRITTKEHKDIYWYISFTALIISMILSLRQRIDIADFAPYVVIAVPLMVKLFLHSYRVRLKIFRIKHHLFVKIMLIILIISNALLLFNKPIYLFLDNPKKHFAYNFHIADELARKLKKLGIKKVEIKDKVMQKRLDYYGVTYGNKYLLSEVKTPTTTDVITINYMNKNIKKYYLMLQK